MFEVFYNKAGVAKAFPLNDRESGFDWEETGVSPQQALDRLNAAKAKAKAAEAAAKAAAKAAEEAAEEAAAAVVVKKVTLQYEGYVVIRQEAKGNLTEKGGKILKPLIENGLISIVYTKGVITPTINFVFQEYNFSFTKVNRVWSIKDSMGQDYNGLVLVAFLALNT